MIMLIPSFTSLFWSCDAIFFLPADKFNFFKNHRSDININFLKQRGKNFLSASNYRVFKLPVETHDALYLLTLDVYLAVCLRFLLSCIKKLHILGNYEEWRRVDLVVNSNILFLRKRSNTFPIIWKLNFGSFYFKGSPMKSIV